jgi:DNA-binding protein
MDEQALSAIRDLLDRQPIAGNVTGALVAAIVSGDPEVTVVARGRVLTKALRLLRGIKAKTFDRSDLCRF